MNKREVCKLKPMTFIELEWDDSPNSVVLLLEKPEPRLGDVLLHCMYDDGTISRHATHTQVVSILGKLQFPDIDWKSKYIELNERFEKYLKMHN